MAYLFKGHNASLVNHIFQTLLITYLSLLLIEEIFPRFVSQYLNLNYLLIFVILAGIADVFSVHPTYIKRKPSKKDYLFIFALGILGFVIIKFKTAQLGWLSWLISIIAGILIILLSILLIEEDEDENQKEKEFNLRPRPTIIFSLISLTIISIAIPLFSSINYLESFRIVFGSVYVLFIPGFIISFIFFPDKIDVIERIALSFALSIAIVPLAVFYLNLIGIKINFLNSFFIILGIIIIASLIVYYKKKK